MLWFSQIVGAKESTPWNYFKVDGVLMNAYNFMQHPMAFENAKKQKIHKYLGYDGPVMMDSGGFLFMKKNDLTVSAEQIISFYEKSKPNFGVVLDHPITPLLSKKVAMERKNKTLRNTKIMLQKQKTKMSLIQRL